ncbi:hypothetical protein AB0C59_11590 [Streptomyces sp. NPDC048664]|uniref:hypothetical protein n=1 Tax=Streptomyces sp. NPDC048664 TaxID=3154505 RepID=UPI0034486245
MQSLPLPLALTARLLPVVVLASAGWALSTGPLAAAPATGHKAAQGGRSTGGTEDTGSGASPSTAPAVKTYATAPAPCGGVTEDTVKSLVPGAPSTGKEIRSTDESVRRTCSWNALKGFDYRWLDVTFEITGSDALAQKSYTQRTTDKSGGGAVPGLGDAAYSVVDLATEDKQQTREGVVIVRLSNALVSITYNGSNFETKKAPGTDEINKGAIKAAKDAAAALKAAGSVKS